MKENFFQWRNAGLRKIESNFSKEMGSEIKEY
jgi:hypothetical protein